MTDTTYFEIDGPFLIKSRTFEDARGFFTERFRADQWKSLLPEHTGFIQDNFSWSNYGVLRGLHFQVDPSQGKLVTCVAGKITDVIVDIRKKSPTLGNHIKVALSAIDPHWLWVPPGFAHGFVVTSEQGAGVLYKVDQPYSPATEGSILWNDSELAIDWPIASPSLSGKDQTAQSFREFLASKMSDQI